MDLLFPAIERRLNGDAALKLSVRKIYHGFAGGRLKATLPYIEVSRVNSAPNDTFGVDLEDYLLQFSLFSRLERPDDANAMVRNLVRVFDHAVLTGPGFHALDMVRVATTGPTVVDAVYQARVDYSVMLQSDVLVPPIRGV